jgi:hypothetical protein
MYQALSSSVTHFLMLQRWRPLEAVLGSIGTHSEVILETIETETMVNRPKPIDVEYLLAEVIPSILPLSRTFILLCVDSTVSNGSVSA